VWAIIVAAILILHNITYVSIPTEKHVKFEFGDEVPKSFYAGGEVIEKPIKTKDTNKMDEIKSNYDNGHAVEISDIKSLRRSSIDNSTAKEIETIINTREKTEVPLCLSEYTFPHHLPYRKNNGLDQRTICYHGQRKLLISEIYFLTKYGDLSKNVLYIGAALGSHILILSKLFPKHKFELYDSNEFDERLLRASNIKCHGQLFLDEDAAKYTSGDYLFISDIRTSEADFEDGVSTDMAFQLKWVRQIRPKAYTLKFRLPYNKPSLKYLDAEIYFQAWTNIGSAETRMMGTELDAMKKYTLKDYEQRLYYLNTVIREFATCRVDDVEKIEHGDHCFDCALEQKILKLYCQKFGSDSADVSNMISNEFDRFYCYNHNVNPIYPRFIQRETQILTNQFVTVSKKRS